ncbi:hypothetical protein IIA29_04995 [candidate division KSB1 bacterium]|nr:hypothetical protein [candidate division KSB1 bacterium]
MLLDEVDTLVRRGDIADGVRGVLNNGWQRGKSAMLSVPTKGGGWQPQSFDVFCPKAMASIGPLWDTVADRSIAIRMRRKLPSESRLKWRLRDASEVEAVLRERLADLRQQQAAVETRLHLLEEMHQAREGLTRAVKAVLDQPDRFPGVRGVLGDALETDRKSAPLVEAALGANLELLLVERIEHLKTLEAATRQLPGRVGFIAMEGIAQPPPEDPTGAAPGWVTPILSMIEVTPEARAAVERLLGRTVVVWDLEAALMLGSGPLAGWRFVTRHREVVEPDGRVTTGPAGSATGGDGWLSRRIERADLGLRLAALNGQIEETSKELDRLTADSAQTQQQRAQVAQELHTARHRVVEKQYQTQQQASDLDRIEREQARVSGEREEVDQRLQQIMKDIHKTCVDVAERFDTPGNYVNGANIGGFLKVADAMLDQGVV